MRADESEIRDALKSVREAKNSLFSAKNRLYVAGDWNKEVYNWIYDALKLSAAAEVHLNAQLDAVTNARK